MAYPMTLTNVVDGSGVTEIVAAHINNLEEKVGIDNSSDSSSLDYLVKNTSSIDPGHKHDHGGLNGLSDNDHPQYIQHSSAITVNDFLVASGVGVFAKQSLATVKTTLGLQSAAYTPATHYSLKVIGGGTTTTSSRGTISVTASLNRQTFVALATVNYVLATGNLVSYVSSATPYLEYTFVNLATLNGVLTVKPGTGNFIANLGTGINISNTSDGTGMPNLIIRLVRSSGSINKWAKISSYKTWG